MWIVYLTGSPYQGVDTQFVTDTGVSKSPLDAKVFQTREEAVDYALKAPKGAGALSTINVKQLI